MAPSAVADLPFAEPPEPPEPLGLVEAPSASIAEETRWLAGLGLPMLAACGFVALTIGVGNGWLLLPAIILVAIVVLMIVYLALASDTNSGP
jgi:hypothetical protein